MRVLPFSVGSGIERFTCCAGVSVDLSKRDSMDMPGKSPTSWTGGMAG